jgi:hypothetical protein
MSESQRRHGLFRDKFRAFFKRLEQYYKYQKLRIFGTEEAFEGLDDRQVFERIYGEGLWGKNPDSLYYSGPGSHEPQVVDAYVAAIGAFLDELGHDLVLVDLGCGDFNVGSRIASKSRQYVACDIVAGVIEANRQRFVDEGIEFRVLDLAKDPLPDGDVIFVRQVLQHLSNASIMRFVQQLQEAHSWRFLVVTESIPNTGTFRENVDKPSGPRIRHSFGSGIDIAKPPFSLRFVRQKVICEVDDGAFSMLRTTVYERGPSVSS